METCTKRAESPPCCLMLASKHEYSLVRTFLPPKPEAPHQGGAQTFKAEQQVARSAAKLEKARQMVSWDKLSDLNPTKWKADSSERRGAPATLVVRMARISALADYQRWQGWGRATAFISFPIYASCWRQAPAAAPGTSLGTPHGLSWANNICLP